MSSDQRLQKCAAALSVSTFIFLALLMDCVRAAPAVPKIACQIGSPNWCIVFGFPGIELTSRGNERVWSFTDNSTMINGPVTIIEREPNCSADKELAVKRLKEKQQEGWKEVVYSLTAEKGCELEFRLPSKGGAVLDTYERALKYGILIGGKQIYSVTP